MRTSRSRTRNTKCSAVKLRAHSSQPSSNSRLMWKLEPGVTGKLRDCDAGWCSFEVEGYGRGPVQVAAHVHEPRRPLDRGLRGREPPYAADGGHGEPVAGRVLQRVAVQ
jgi:hypothetical protein